MRLVLGTVARRCPSSLCEYVQQFQFLPSIVHTFHCSTPPSSPRLLPNQIKVKETWQKPVIITNSSGLAQGHKLLLFVVIFCRDYQGTLADNLELTEYPPSEFHSKQTRAVFVK